MSCSKCALHRRDFASESDYFKFSKTLSESVTKGDLTKIGHEQPEGPYLRIRYACMHCGANWILSVPDQAFRGEWREIA